MSASLGEEQKSEFKKLFDFFDKENHGSISKEDVGKALDILNLEASHLVRIYFKIWLNYSYLNGI
jgi:Ca2+-binding EF-hand superfamily protein